MREVIVWSKEYFPFSDSEPLRLIVARNYDLNADLVRSVVVEEVFKKKREYLIESYRIRENLADGTEVKFLFSQEVTDRKRKKIDELIEEIDRKLENVYEIRFSKVYKTDLKKVYEEAKNVIEVKNYNFFDLNFNRAKFVGGKEGEVLEIEIPLRGEFFSGYGEGFDDKRLIYARFQENSKGTEVYLLIHEGSSSDVKWYIEKFFKYLDKNLQKSPELSIEVRNPRKENAK